MAVLTFLFFGCVVLIIISIKSEKYQGLLKHLGIFALIFGLFTQLLSLIQIMSALEQIGEVSTAMLAGGLRVSLIAPIYGLIIFLLANLAIILLKLKAQVKL